MRNDEISGACSLLVATVFIVVAFAAWFGIVAMVLK